MEYKWIKDPTMFKILRTQEGSMRCDEWNHYFCKFAWHMTRQNQEKYGYPDTKFLDNHPQIVKWLQENGFLEYKLELEPCCYCGFNPKITSCLGQERKVFCPNCRAAGPRKATNARATLEWNEAMRTISANTLNHIDEAIKD